MAFYAGSSPPRFCQIRMPGLSKRNLRPAALGRGGKHDKHHELLSVHAPTTNTDVS